MPKPFGDRTKEGFEKLLTKLKIKRKLDEEEPQQSKSSCCAENKFDSDRFNPVAIFDYFIRPLRMGSFKRYLRRTDRAMVMFHHYLDEETRASIRKYNDASAKTVRLNHGYAYVDCRRDYQLCTDMGVKQTPMYKIYNKGILRQNVIEEPSLTSEKIKELMEAGCICETLTSCNSYSPILITAPDSTRNHFAPSTSSCCLPNSFESDRFMRNGRFDDFIDSLNIDNFGKYIVSKDSSVVMFHHYLDEETRSAIRKFNDASTKTSQKHSFAYVDCRKHYQLCDNEDIKEMPSYHIYQQGELKQRFVEDPTLTSEKFTEIVHAS